MAEGAAGVVVEKNPLNQLPPGRQGWGGASRTTDPGALLGPHRDGFHLRCPCLPARGRTGAAGPMDSEEADSERKSDWDSVS